MSRQRDEDAPAGGVLRDPTRRCEERLAGRQTKVLANLAILPGKLSRHAVDQRQRAVGRVGQRFGQADLAVLSQFQHRRQEPAKSRLESEAGVFEDEQEEWGTGGAGRAQQVVQPVAPP